MKKFSLLLLDANVVIVLCKVGLWGHVLEKCEILLARTVFEEPFFYLNDSGDKIYFSLEEDEKAGRLKVVDVPVKDVLAFKAQFTDLFAGDIDPGEAEALAYLFSQNVTHSICSADKIVFRVLGCLGKSDQGLSLEEILKQCGLTKKLPKEFGKEYREHWTAIGFTEGQQGRALKKKD
jgi:hypothetical protein